MRIQVSDGERNICILFPTGLAFSRLTALIGCAAIKKYAPGRDLSVAQINALFAELRRIKAKHGAWELLDVQGSDGEMVKIIL